jgi:hypothetical protein
MIENTLGIKEMKIVKTMEYFNKYMGKSLTFWVGNSPIYYCIDTLTAIRIVPLGSHIVIIFFGSNDDIKFAVGIDNGFGFRQKGSKDNIWIDKLSQTEMAIIVYEQIEDKENLADK